MLSVQCCIYKFMSCTCPVHVLYMFLTCPVHVLYMSCTCSVHVLYMSCTCSVLVMYLLCTCMHKRRIHMQCTVCSALTVGIVECAYIMWCTEMVFVQCLLIKVSVLCLIVLNVCFTCILYCTLYRVQSIRTTRGTKIMWSL